MPDLDGPVEEYSLPVLKHEGRVHAILKAQDEYCGRSTRSCPHSNFLKGAKWSPDGSCLVTASEDSRFRIYDLPEDVLQRAAVGDDAEQDRLAATRDDWAPALRVAEGETVYDYCWFPAMQAADPVTCVFATTSRAHPAHLWDACDGSLRCTYRAYDAMDEVTAATSLAFSLDGSRLFGGFNRMIRVWDTSRPGRDCREMTTFRKGTDGLPGIVSSMSFNPDRSGLMAAGSYSGQAALYDSASSELLFLLQGQKGGITQVKFGPDGNFLFTGGRADCELWCWDIRFHSGVVYKLERDTPTTNQRIHFDIEPCGRHLATGGQNGAVQVFDLSDGKLVKSFQAAADTVNGFEFHPYLPLAATASGHRRFANAWSSDSDSDSEARMSQPVGAENALLLWRFDHEWITIDQPLHGGEEEAVDAPEGMAADFAEPKGFGGSPGSSKPEDDVVAEAASRGADEREVYRVLPVTAEQPVAHNLPKQSSAETSTGFAGLPKLVPFGQEMAQ